MRKELKMSKDGIATLTEKIEDYTVMSHFIANVAVALSRGIGLPNFINMLHDSAISNDMSIICTEISRLRNKNND